MDLINFRLLVLPQSITINYSRLNHLKFSAYDTQLAETFLESILN